MVSLLFIPPGATGFHWARAVLPPLLLATAVQAWSAPVLPVSDQATAPRRPDPLDPKSPVPALVYRGSLPLAGAAAAGAGPAASMATGNDKPIPWRQANDAVARIGGWRAYAREAQQADPGGPAATAAPAAHATHAAPAAPTASAAPAAPAAARSPSAARSPLHQHQP